MLDVFITQKKFGDSTILENAGVRIFENGIYGFFGKNGQGKTTFFNCLLNLTSYNGKIVFDQNELTRQQVGWLPTEPEMYEYLTVKEFINFYAISINGVKADNSKFLFDVQQDLLIKNCSTGTKKKVYMNAVLQGNYDLYIFDEPFNGLDIESNNILLKYLKELSQEKIILLSSHIIEFILPYTKQDYLVNETKIVEVDKAELLKVFTV